jgi:hypothetical protein
MTDPRSEAEMFEGLPREISSLRDVVQGLVVHVFWARKYGLTLSEDRERELQMRSVEEKLKQIRKLDDRPLVEPRPPERRLVGNCRDFCILLCSMLRSRGVAARARCGFARYFAPNHFEDHWVCEYRGGTGRWTMVDAQLDALQRDSLGITFDALDVPASEFITGGRAWELCRGGRADPDTFGILDLHGLWFVRGNLLRDLASLNKVELLPWDAWGLADKDEKELTESDLALLDLAAVTTQANDSGFNEVRSFYQRSEGLRVPTVIRSYTKSGVQAVELVG